MPRRRILPFRAALRSPLRLPTSRGAVPALSPRIANLIPDLQRLEREKPASFEAIEMYTAEERAELEDEPAPLSTTVSAILASARRLEQVNPQKLAAVRLLVERQLGDMGR